MAKPQSLDELIGKKAAEFAEQVRHAAAWPTKRKKSASRSNGSWHSSKKRRAYGSKASTNSRWPRGGLIRFTSACSSNTKTRPAPATALARVSIRPAARRSSSKSRSASGPWRTTWANRSMPSSASAATASISSLSASATSNGRSRNPSRSTRYSAERFLWALYNLGNKGKPFQPEYLAGDFGATEGSIATEGIHALYDAIATTDHPKAQTFFKQWKILFGEVCGYDVDNPSDKIKNLAEFYGLPSKDSSRPSCSFAAHVLRAVHEIAGRRKSSRFSTSLPTPLKGMLSAVTSAKLKREMEELEAGSIFRHLNITNFLEGDLFAWYTAVWTEPIERLVRRMVAKLDDYNPGTMSEDPATSRDLLKKLYQQLFPKSVRHDLGEYYTPDWLAEHVLNEIGYSGDPDKRLLIPPAAPALSSSWRSTASRAGSKRTGRSARLMKGICARRYWRTSLGLI